MASLTCRKGIKERMKEIMNGDQKAEERLVGIT